MRHAEALLGAGSGATATIMCPRFKGDLFTATEVYLGVSLALAIYGWERNVGPPAGPNVTGVATGAVPSWQLGMQGSGCSGLECLSRFETVRRVRRSPGKPVLYGLPVQIIQAGLRVPQEFRAVRRIL